MTFVMGVFTGLTAAMCGLIVIQQPDAPFYVGAAGVVLGVGCALVNVVGAVYSMAGR